jgi:hypothetical protein
MSNPHPLLTSTIIEAILEDNKLSLHVRNEYQNGTTSKVDTIDSLIEFLFDFNLNRITKKKDWRHAINRFISK